MRKPSVEDFNQLESISTRVQNTKANRDPRLPDNAVLGDMEWLTAQLRQAWQDGEKLEKALKGLLNNQALELGTDLSEAVEAYRSRQNSPPDETL